MSIPISVEVSARFTLALLLVSHIVSWSTPHDLADLEAPIGLVLGQNLWNATQVGHLFLWVQVLSSQSRRWLIPSIIMWLFWLPWAHYLVSIGGSIHSVMIALTCLWGLKVKRQTEVSITPSSPQSSQFENLLKPLVEMRLELIALLCNLGSSLYNYNASRRCWPHWNDLYFQLGELFEFSPDPADVARALYTFGLEGSLIPNYLPLAVGNPTGAVVFSHLWGILPALYILYFIILYLNSSVAPGGKIQRILCLFGIIHFLFLTDLVDYKFARGFKTHYGEWGHWTERFAWRIAILLPIYQKMMSGEWISKGRLIGPLLHYGIGLWAVIFFVYQVLIYDTVRFFYFAMGINPSEWLLWLKSIYIQELGYHGALVLMVILYTLLVLSSRSGTRLVMRRSSVTLEER